MAELIDLGRRGVHRPREQDGFEHEDHEEQVFQPRGIAQQGSPLSLRPPHHRDHRLHRPEPHLRRRVHRLEIHRRQLVPLGAAQVSGQLLGHYKKIQVKKVQVKMFQITKKLLSEMKSFRLRLFIWDLIC